MPNDVAYWLTKDHRNFIVCTEDEIFADYEEHEGGTEANDENDGLLPRLPTNRVKHKGYIGKIMFLCAQARPRFDPHRNSVWDGKLGMWPIGEWVRAARGSVHRPAGTLCWKCKTVDQQVYRDLLLQKVVPAIMERWPRRDLNNNRVVIRIQQDGPQSHIRPDDQGFYQGLQRLGMQNKVLLYTQPPNSPDLNINDLGLFRALQASYEKLIAKNASEIIDNINRVYAEYETERINKVYLSLMTVMNMIVKRNGDNDFDVPHIGKDALARRGQLPKSIEVADELLEYLGVLNQYLAI